jgi:hypothetical protein
MTDEPRPGVLTLFVLSNDYGELLLARSFLEGQALSERAAVLLPERLYETNGKSLPVPTHRYADLRDIVEVFEAHKPQAVVLCSGYLFSNNRLLSSGDLRKLVRHMQTRGSLVLTTDPFLGLAAGLTFRDVHLATAGRVRGFLQRSAERSITRDLVRVAKVLEGVVHLYPAPTDALGATDDVRRVSFFNRSWTRAAGDAGAWESKAEKRWLFVLAPHDLSYQKLQIGIDALVDRLNGRFEETRRAGRVPVLMGPPDLLREISDRPSGTVAELLDFSGYDAFIPRLLAAEYVFYWNLLSASFLARIVKPAPAFFFDRGHLSRLVEPIYEVGVRAHLRGWEPRYLDLSQPLDPKSLAADARDQVERFQEIVAEWERSPSPDALLAELLQNAPPAANPWRVV